jgi:hypothetical protein
MTKLEQAIFEIAVEYMKGRASSRSEAEVYLLEANPETTPISGMNYTDDTEPFAQKFHEEIVELIQDYYGQGELIPATLLDLNEQTWFAWGRIVSRIQDKVLDAIQEDFVDEEE